MASSDIRATLEIFLATTFVLADAAANQEGLAGSSTTPSEGKVSQDQWRDKKKRTNYSHQRLEQQ